MPSPSESVTGEDSESHPGWQQTLIERVVALVLRHEVPDEPDLDVGVLATDDAAIQNLNRDYRGIDASTDVLAFAMREGVDAGLNPHLLGDIAISVGTAERQAADAGHSVETELAILAIHGTLHLLGYDHDADDDYERMRARETELLAEIVASADWRDALRARGE